jgi:hypothetical protein
MADAGERAFPGSSRDAKYNCHPFKKVRRGCSMSGADARPQTPVVLPQTPVVPPQTPVVPLSSPWKKWLAEVLILYTDESKILKVLMDNGLEESSARESIREAVDDPYIEIARQYSEKLLRRDWLLSILHKSQRLSSCAHSVERRANLASDEFLEHYYSANRPVILTELLKNWTALGKWDPKYLKDNLGHHIVEVQAGRGSDPVYEQNHIALKKKLPFGEYIDLITSLRESNDYYMTANNAESNGVIMETLLGDIQPFPEYLTADLADGENGKAYLWFGPAGTITPLHHDMSNVLFAQVRGRKRFLLYSPLQMPYMYHYRNYFSQVDPENVDRDRFPLFRKAKPIEITVAPGEVLFIPIGWWHHVRALDLSISISFSNFRFKNRYPESPFQRNNATRLNEIENRDAMMAVSAAYV